MNDLLAPLQACVGRLDQEALVELNQAINGQLAMLLGNNQLAIEITVTDGVVDAAAARDGDGEQSLNWLSAREREAVRQAIHGCLGVCGS